MCNRNLQISSLVAVAGLAAFLAAAAAAQQPAVKPGPQAVNIPKSQPATSVVDSPEWAATRDAYMQWLSMQQVYSPQEVQKLVNDLRLRVAGMNERERVAFMKDIQARLEVLNSQQAQQARAWLNENLSRMTPAGQQKLRSQIPDIANMSAAQLQQALAGHEMQMQARQRSSAATAQFRAQQNQMAMQMSQQRQQAFVDARQRQQAAVAGQASNRVQQNFQQSQQNAANARANAAASSAPLINPYVWVNPWVW